MPQMAPLMWLMLFTVFSSMLLISMIKNYFLLQKKIHVKNNQEEITKSYFNWKW